MLTTNVPHIPIGHTYKRVLVTLVILLFYCYVHLETFRDLPCDSEHVCFVITFLKCPTGVYYMCALTFVWLLSFLCFLSFA